VDGVEGDFAEGPDVDATRFEFDGGNVEAAAFTMGGGDAAEGVGCHMFGDEALERAGVEDGVGGEKLKEPSKTSLSRMVV